MEGVKVQRFNLKAPKFWVVGNTATGARSCPPNHRVVSIVLTSMSTTTRGSCSKRAFRHEIYPLRELTKEIGRFPADCLSRGCSVADTRYPNCPWTRQIPAPKNLSAHLLLPDLTISRSGIVCFQAHIRASTDAIALPAIMRRRRGPTSTGEW